MIQTERSNTIWFKTPSNGYIIYILHVIYRFIEKFNMFLPSMKSTYFCNIQVSFLMVTNPFNFTINYSFIFCLQESIHVPSPVISMSIKPVDKNSTDNFSKGNKCYDKKKLNYVIGIHVCNQSAALLSSLTFLHTLASVSCCT